MSIASAEDFVERMSSDIAFREAMFRAADREELRERIDEAGFSFSSEELAYVVQNRYREPLSWKA